ncbi:MAG: hypothetical protein GWO20_15805 [Candidatus Korarchaeota archaeon]|nr:hypothetical protein [Candidatus Korarchaeota archaeon]NIU84936.1 hypothetical protein [Candidatus Thorarchaeota archaeon]NIW14953.1 hypothetical protein [Candidatus Thorarchaeota archaeon]NIW52920.1 hypothetical protein [Candidatus Korarchaeota archaeon]
MRVVFLYDVEAQELEVLRENLRKDIDITSIQRTEKDLFLKQANRFDALVGARVPKEFLEPATNLKYFIIPFAGIPKEDKKTLSEFPNLTILNCHYNAPFVAEHALALLLASARKVCSIHNQLKNGDWTPRYEREWGVTLRKKTLLILGYGKIGEYLAEMTKGLGMVVKAIKRTPGKAPELDFLGTNEDLHRLLPEADFIVCTLPETESTRGYLGEKEFELMKEGVHLVNVGRGPVIVEEAFYEALKSGKLGGAGIDTWWVYPDEDARSNTFPSHYPLDDFENVVFSPHRASHVRERERYRMQRLARILNSLASGVFINVVDLEAGY